MSDSLLFIGKFLRHGTKIASLAPSSPWLSRATIRPIDWSKARTVVELGAGTGPITRAIADRAPESCRVLVIERDPDFARLLRARFAAKPHFEVLEADCRDLQSILAERGIDRADHIVSGLPVPSFPKELQLDLFRVVKKVLAPDGSYSQITEIPLVYRGLYRGFFDEVRFVFEPRNFPPAGCYHCRGPKDVA
jgi:phosphatidylethanolamine/phosphatidyl-N-methylethanolamine N-methyltransferase